jgi:hypothetical protein
MPPKLDPDAISIGALLFFCQQVKEKANQSMRACVCLSEVGCSYFITPLLLHFFVCLEMWQLNERQHETIVV